MLRTLKRQLSKFPTVVLAAVLAIPFLGFFIYVFVHNSDYSLFAALFFLTVIMLNFSHLRIRRKQAETDLRCQEIQEDINVIHAEVDREQRSLNAIRQKISHYSQLKVLTEKLGMSFSLSEASAVLADEVEKIFGAKEMVVIIYLFHSPTGALGLSFSQKRHQIVNIKAKQGDFYDEWIVKNMKPLLVEDTHSDFRFYSVKTDPEKARSIRSLMSVPLVLGSKAIGILRVDSQEERQFTTDDIRLLSVIGDLAAVTLENVQLYERVEDLAIHDGLTGLFLRRHFIERLADEMHRALRRKTELSLLMIDLDKFKHYNDTYGHTAGDIMLKTVAMILSYMFDQPGNMVCRYGGEEFAILLPDCPRDKALERAEDLRKKIESQPIILRREKTHITASIGVTTFPQDAHTKEELIHLADAALYQAKHRGRNRVCQAKEK